MLHAAACCNSMNDSSWIRFVFYMVTIYKYNNIKYDKFVLLDVYSRTSFGIYLR